MTSLIATASRRQRLSSDALADLPENLCIFRTDEHLFRMLLVWMDVISIVPNNVADAVYGLSDPADFVSNVDVVL